MSRIYEERPNIVEVTMTDKSGTAVRHIVGYTLDEVIEAVVLGLDGAEKPAAPARKTHRRRTKAEIAAAKDPVPAEHREPAAANAREDKPWP